MKTITTIIAASILAAIFAFTGCQKQEGERRAPGTAPTTTAPTTTAPTGTAGG